MLRPRDNIALAYVAINYISWYSLLRWALSYFAELEVVAALKGLYHLFLINNCRRQPDIVTIYMFPSDQCLPLPYECPFQFIFIYFFPDICSSSSIFSMILVCDVLLVLSFLCVCFLNLH